MQDAALIRACEIANSDEDLRAIEREFELISGDIAEPWRNAPCSLAGFQRDRANSGGPEVGCSEPEEWPLNQVPAGDCEQQRKRGR